MHKFIFLLLPLAFVCACQKNEPAPPPPPDDHPFSVTLDNGFGLLQNHYVAYLSDTEGKIVAYRGLKSTDTTQLTAPGQPVGAALDLTIAETKTFHTASGNGQDSSLSLRTFVAVPNGAFVRLRDQEYRQECGLSITFTGITSFDSIIVPDGVAYSRPQALNNYTGVYRAFHTGKIWLRILVNGETDWRYMFFDNVQAPNIDLSVDVHLLPIETHPKTLQLPFVSPWQYRIDGIIDTAQHRFLPLGDLLRAPGGSQPVFDKIAVFEPIRFDPLAPTDPPYQGFRLRFEGKAPNGDTYFYDNFAQTLPTELPDIPSQLTPTTLSDNRLAGVRCSGDPDVLVLRRTNTRIVWETYAKPAPDFFYRLPNVPVSLGFAWPDLYNYDFGQTVRARAENYTLLGGYEAVLGRIFAGTDRFWQAKAGYVGKEIEL